MAKSIEQLLGAVYLTALVEKVKPGLPDFAPEEFAGQTEDIIGHTARHMRVAGTRQVSTQIAYDAPASRISLRGISAQDISLIHTHEEISLPHEVFRLLHNYTDWNVQQLGMQELKRQAEQFRTRFDNHVIAARTSVLNTGKIFYSVAGNLLPSSSGADLTIDMGIPASNLNQCSSSLTASWATASTDIVGDLMRLKNLALQTTGYSIEGGWALHGINIPKYFGANTVLKEFLVRNQGPGYLNYADSFLRRGEIPDGFMGFKWKNMSGAFYHDETDTKQTWWDGDQITFTPPVSKAWWANARGTHPIPKQWGISQSIEEAFNSWEYVHGLASYAYPTMPNQPPAAMLAYKDTWMPWIKVPAAVFIADTVF